MKRILKWFFILAPVLAWLLVVGSCSYKQLRIDRVLKEADGLLWGTGDKQLSIRVIKVQEDEKLRFTVQVLNALNEVQQAFDFEVDFDMWGGGFVRASDIDQDLQPEVIVWGAHEHRLSYYLDYSDGAVLKKPFSEAPENAKALASDWHKVHVTGYFGSLSLIFPLIGYYLLLLTIRILLRLIRRFGARTAAS